jgi:hypothetical protein
MSTPPAPPHQDPTADYRKYPKGPNFGLIVALFCVTLILFFVASLFFLHADVRHLIPGRKHPNPATQLEPNPPLRPPVSATAC